MKCATAEKTFKRRSPALLFFSRQSGWSQRTYSGTTLRDFKPCFAWI